MRSRPDGMALPLVLLLLLALTALGHGTLLLARRELSTVWAFRHAIRAGQAAEASLKTDALPEYLFLGQRVPWIGHSLGKAETGDGLKMEKVFRWLDQEFFLLEGTGGSRGWKGERRRALVGWSLDPEARLGAFSAAFEVGGGPGQGSDVVATDVDLLGPPEAWPEDVWGECQVVLDSIFPGGPIPSTGPLVEQPHEDSGAGASIPPLGLLTGSRLLDLAWSGGSGTHSPQDLDRGCPMQSPVLEGTGGSRILSGGRVCGLLVVEGDLILRGDARFQGLALVGGDLVLEDGAVLEGMARIRGGLLLKDKGTLISRACPVIWSLKGLPELQQLLAFPDGAKLTAF